MAEHLFNCDTRNPEEMDLPCNCEELKAKAALPTYRELMEERIGLERFKTAYMEWQDKTEWVQKTATAKELGRHRADVMADRIAELERDKVRLESEAMYGAASYREALEEIQRLKSQLNTERGLHMAECNKAVRLHNELEACRKDAELFRRLRDAAIRDHGYTADNFDAEFLRALDAIDAAMQEGGV